MASEGVCLVVDQVFRDKCWAKFLADSNGKRALVARDVALEPRRSLEEGLFPGRGCKNQSAPIARRSA
jgi:hypothetical protein